MRQVFWDRLLVIRSKKDAKAVCLALSKLPLDGASRRNRPSSALHLLAAQFQEVAGPDVPAFEVLYREGLPQLIRASMPACER